MNTSLSLLAICLLACITTNAQTDFSGTWIFNNQQSISGNLYSNGSPKQITITQTDNNVIIKKVTVTGDGTDAITTDTLSFNGKPFRSITSSKRNKESTFQWNDNKSSFTTIGTAFNPTNKTKADFKTTDMWSIDNDQLVLTRKSENFTNSEVWESKAVYDKQ